MQSHQGINPRSVEEADVFAVHQAGGYTCVEVFFFRTGQNWGNRAYFPKADRALGAGRGARRLPGAVLRRQAAAAAAFWCRTISRSASCSREALCTKSRPQGRGQRAAARRAQGTGRRTRSPMRARRWRASSPTPRRSSRLLTGADRDLRAAARAAPHRGLRQQPHRRHQRGRRHGRRRAGRLSQEPVPQVQHPLGRSHARRRLRHDARGACSAASSG